MRRLGIVQIGTGASLVIRHGTVGGAAVLDFRNFLRDAGGFSPAGGGAMVGADQIPALIEILETARAAQ